MKDLPHVLKSWPNLLEIMTLWPIQRILRDHSCRDTLYNWCSLVLLYCISYYTVLVTNVTKTTITLFSELPECINFMYGTLLSPVNSQENIQASGKDDNYRRQD